MRYELKNVHVTSYQTSGASAANELPREDFTFGYTRIDPSIEQDEFVFTDDGSGTEKPKFEWIEIKPPPKPPGDYAPYDSEVQEYDLINSGNGAPIIDDVFMF